MPAVTLFFFVFATFDMNLLFGVLTIVIESVRSWFAGALVACG
jgi:hypothetical protein